MDVVGGSRAYENTGLKNEATTFLKAGYRAGSIDLFGDAQLRWARFRYDGDIPLGSVSWTFFNPKLGARWAMGRDISLYASVGRTTREPTRNDMLAGEDNATLRYDLEAVEPEQVTDLEVGLDWRWTGLTLHANGYAMEFRDEIALTGELSEIGLPLRRNVDRSFRRGLELDATWVVTGWLRLRTAASLSRNRIREWTQFYDVYDEAGTWVAGDARTHRDVPPLLTPAVVVNQSADWSPRPWLQVAATGRYVSESQLDNTGNAYFRVPSSFSLDGSLVVDLSRRAKAVKPRLRIQVNNVLDRRIYASGYSYLFLTRDAGGRDALGGIPYYYPLATRAVYVSLELAR
jgi:iron complex outermembrane receptor protein